MKLRSRRLSSQTKAVRGVAAVEQLRKLETTNKRTGGKGGTGEEETK